MSEEPLLYDLHRLVSEFDVSPADALLILRGSSMITEAKARDRLDLLRRERERGCQS
jgi:hypothetical protein